MVPAAVVDAQGGGVLPLLEPGDVVIDGGNSYYVDDLRRAAMSNTESCITWTWD